MLQSPARTSLFLLAVASLLASTVSLDAEPPLLKDSQRKELIELWHRYARSKGEDGNCRHALLRGGEASLEVLIDLISLPRALAGPDRNKRVAELVGQLGAERVTTRDAATWQLQAMLPAVRPFLSAYASHPDPEVRHRLRMILGDGEAARQEADAQAALLRSATAILEAHWPMDQLCRVTRRNLDRLAWVEKVEHGWFDRPISPLLASLRYSSDPAERELLGTFAMTARPGAAQTALQVMTNGLAGRTNSISNAWRVPVPPHDYSKAAFACLDPERPTVFKAAMYYLVEDKRLVPRLHELLDKIKDDELRGSVYFVLWHWHSDIKARDYYFTMLSSPDDSKFEAAVYCLTDYAHQYKGPSIIPKLRPVLRGSDPKRRLLVLGQLDRYLGRESVALAADEAAPFLASPVAAERELGRRVLLELQGTRWINVLQHVAERTTDEKVRAEARQLLAEWEKESAKRGKK